MSQRTQTQLTKRSMSFTITQASKKEVWLTVFAFWKFVSPQKSLMPPVYVGHMNVNQVPINLLTDTSIKLKGNT